MKTQISQLIKHFVAILIFKCKHKQMAVLTVMTVHLCSFFSVDFPRLPEVGPDSFN